MKKTGGRSNDQHPGREAAGIRSCRHPPRLKVGGQPMTDRIEALTHRLKDRAGHERFTGSHRADMQAQGRSDGHAVRHQRHPPRAAAARIRSSDAGIRARDRSCARSAAKPREHWRRRNSRTRHLCSTSVNHDPSTRYAIRRSTLSRLPLRVRRIASADFSRNVGVRNHGTPTKYRPISRHQLPLAAIRPFHFNRFRLNEFSTHLRRKGGRLNYQMNVRGLRHDNLQ